jgi:hypothetical protein
MHGRPVRLQAARVRGELGPRAPIFPATADVNMIETREALDNMCVCFLVAACNQGARNRFGQVIYLNNWVGGGGQIFFAGRFGHPSANRFRKFLHTGTLKLSSFTMRA